MAWKKKKRRPIEDHRQNLIFQIPVSQEKQEEDTGIFFKDRLKHIKPAVARLAPAGFSVFAQIFKTPIAPQTRILNTITRTSKIHLTYCLFII